MPSPALTAPSITEDDLLAFQYAHFGDDSKPENWIVDAETALNVQSAQAAEEEEDLGCYEDGSKRTLTDDQIAMFRHSEIQELLRERRLEREEEEYQNREPEAADSAGQGARSPMSDASSIEGDLVGLARPRPKQPYRPPPKRQPSQSSRSESSRSTGQSRTSVRKRRTEVPYDERHKRKWEDYIDENDPIEGSLTHRRIVRQLDEQQAETVDMDY
ncbi:hypothetical protein LTR85_002007 [Meristemomyces frigidus]|nr:hypothetical protein LTR85_002007 [Meristemomyces frigidus]